MARRNASMVRRGSGCSCALHPGPSPGRSLDTRASTPMVSSAAFVGAVADRDLLLDNPAPRAQAEAPVERPILGYLRRRPWLDAHMGRFDARAAGRLRPDTGE